MDAVPSKAKRIRKGGEGVPQELKLEHRWQRPKVIWPIAARHISLAGPMLRPLPGFAVHLLLGGAGDSVGGAVSAFTVIPRELGRATVDPDFSCEGQVTGFQVVAVFSSDQPLVGGVWNPTNGSTAHPVLPAEPGSGALLEPADPGVSAAALGSSRKGIGLMLGDFSKGAYPLLLAQHGGRDPSLPPSELVSVGGVAG